MIKNIYNWEIDEIDEKVVDTLRKSNKIDKKVGKTKRKLPNKVLKWLIQWLPEPSQ